MEINLKKLNDQEIQNTTTSKNMRLSEDASSMIFQIFTKKVYSNPIGTIVREIASNCFDSHIEANINPNTPIIIRKSFDSETNTTYISFIDFGVGMSPDRIENIYGVYFNSTKRSDNQQIGGYGIGGKTPLAYRRKTGIGENEYDNSFYVITNYNGTRYYYCIYEGPESPVISLLHEEKTTEHNGTEIRIPVLLKDISSFEKEIVRQLYYFENIIFEGFDSKSTYSDIINSEYQIVRGKSFLFRGTHYSEYIHVCLGRVAYPIDYSILGLNYDDYKIPVAIRLNIGDINVTIGRETLDYDEKTIKILKKKVEEVKTELIHLLNKQYENVQTLEDYFKLTINFGELQLPNGIIKLRNYVNLDNYKLNNFKYNLFRMPDDQQLFSLFFKIRLLGKKFTGGRRMNLKNKAETFIGKYDEILTHPRNVYFMENDETKLDRLKSSYLKTIHQYRYYIITPANLFDPAIKKSILDVFNIDDTLISTNGTPTHFMNNILEMQSEFLKIVQSNIKYYSNITVPEEFIETRKRKKLDKSILNETITITFPNSRSKERIKLKSLFKLNGRIFYGTKNDSNLFNIPIIISKIFWNNIIIRDVDYNNEFEFNGKKNIIFIEIAQNNVRYMKFCKHAHHISEFYNILGKRKYNIIRELIQITNLSSKFDEIEKIYKHNNFEYISPNWIKDINMISKFIESNTNKDIIRKIEGFETTLCEYYSIDPNVQTHKIKNYHKILDNGLFVQNENREILKFIEIPYSLDHAPDIFWKMLKYNLKEFGVLLT